jgi:hypothetical protein
MLRLQTVRMGPDGVVVYAVWSGLSDTILIPIYQWLLMFRLARLYRLGVV